MKAMRVLFWGLTYALLVVGVVIFAKGGPAFIYQGF